MTKSIRLAGQAVRGRNVVNTASRTPHMSQQSLADTPLTGTALL
ncbi:hypothetical protein ACJ73_06776, partial [Blastomyces percursus]